MKTLQIAQLPGRACCPFRLCRSGSPTRELPFPSGGPGSSWFMTHHVHITEKGSQKWFFGAKICATSNFSWLIVNWTAHGGHSPREGVRNYERRNKSARLETCGSPPKVTPHFISPQLAFSRCQHNRHILSQIFVHRTAELLHDLT